MTERARRLYVRFRTESRFYVYDAATNHILTVSEALWRRLDGYLAERDALPFRPDAATGAVTQTDATVRDIEQGLAQGFLAPCEIAAMRFYDSDEALRAAIRTRIPHLTLELTQHCNLRCHYCPYTYHPERTDRPQRMSWETLKNALEAFLARSGDATNRSISFWGGEPLLAFALLRDAVAYVRSRAATVAPTFQFTTNGTLLTEEIGDFLADNDMRLLVSLDGPQATHDRHRVDHAGRGTFGAIESALRRLRERHRSYYGQRVRFVCVITPDTDVDETADYFRSNELTRSHSVALNIVAPPAEFVADFGRFGRQHRSELRRRMRDAVIRANGDSSDPMAKAGEKWLFGLATRGKQPMGDVLAPNGCCVPLLKKMHVRTDGSIHLCERVDDDHSLGNVNAGGVDEGRVVDLVHEYCRNAIGDCRRCWAARLCVLCYKECMTENRWRTQDREAVCERSRERVLEALEDYARVLEGNPAALAHLKNVTVSLPV